MFVFLLLCALSTLNVHLFNPIVGAELDKISMATEATARMWRTLEDALGPSRDEGMHLSRKLNCTSDSGPKAQLIKLAGNRYMQMGVEQLVFKIPSKKSSFSSFVLVFFVSR